MHDKHLSDVQIGKISTTMFSSESSSICNNTKRQNATVKTHAVHTKILTLQATWMGEQSEDLTV